MLYQRMILGGLLVVLLSGCSGEKTKWIKRAPRSNAEAGIVVYASRAQIEKLLTSGGFQARELNRRHSLYEIFKASAQDIKMIAPDIQIKGVNRVLQFRAASESMQLKQDVVIVNGTASNLTECRPSIHSPTAQIEITNDNVTATISLGEKLPLNATKSFAHPQVGGDLKMAWTVSGPENSEVSDEVFYGDSLLINPDVVGSYSVGLIVQDNNQACSFAQMNFSVTANPDIEPAIQGATLSPEEHQTFWHLDQLHAENAHQYSQGEGIVIAIVDSGVNYNHPDISSNIYRDEREADVNGDDDNQNGQLDDIIGWDFVNGDNRPFDDDGHGTHVAGLAASPTFGLAPKAKILPVKVIDADGSGDLASIAAGIIYAVDSGANIVNLSVGAETNKFDLLEDAIHYAEEHNVVIVAAAGNGDPFSGVGFDILERPFYPAKLNLDNMINVAATDELGLLTDYSNYQADLIHVATFGGTMMTPIFSATTLNPQQTRWRATFGTSMATPIVSGIVALVMSQNPQLLAKQIRPLLEAGSQATTSMNLSVHAHGALINIEDLLANLSHQ